MLKRGKTRKIMIRNYKSVTTSVLNTDLHCYMYVTLLDNVLYVNSRYWSYTFPIKKNRDLFGCLICLLTLESHL